MNIQELEALVDKGESQRLEFKQSTGQRTNAARTVCAMLNDIGGCVLFGVRDNGTIVGQDVTDQTLRALSSELSRIEPPAFPDIETVQLKSGATVIALIISGGGGPYIFDGSCTHCRTCCFRENDPGRPALVSTACNPGSIGQCIVPQGLYHTRKMATPSRFGRNRPIPCT